MRLFPTEKIWCRALLVAFFLFLGTRLLTLTAFPIFNDEANSVQYAQAIHDDWAHQKFISMNGTFHDWKPPLQYWIAAPFISLGNDPLVAGRMVSLLVSICGLFGFYAFTNELFGEREGVLAAFLYLLCPSVLFYNNQFIAETFLFSTAPLFYWTVLRALRPTAWRWGWSFLAIVLGTATGRGPDRSAMGKSSDRNRGLREAFSESCALTHHKRTIEQGYAAKSGTNGNSSPAGNFLGRRFRRSSSVAGNRLTPAVC